MKKIISLLLVFVMVFSFTACRNDKEDIENTKNPEKDVTEQVENNKENKEDENKKDEEYANIEVNLEEVEDAKNLFIDVANKSKDGSQIVLEAGNSNAIVNGFSFTSESYVNYITFVLGTTKEQENATIFNCEGYNELLVYSSSVAKERTIVVFNPETGETREFTSPYASDLAENKKVLKLKETIDLNTYEGILLLANNVGTKIDISGWNQVGFYATDEENATIISCAALVDPVPVDLPKEEMEIEGLGNVMSLFYNNVAKKNKDGKQTILLRQGKGLSTATTKNKEYVLESVSNYTKFVIGDSIDKSKATIFNCEGYDRLMLCPITLYDNTKENEETSGENKDKSTKTNNEITLSTNEFTENKENTKDDTIILDEDVLLNDILGADTESMNVFNNIIVFNPETNEEIVVPTFASFLLSAEMGNLSAILGHDEEFGNIRNIATITDKYGVILDISGWKQIGFYATNTNSLSFISAVLGNSDESDYLKYSFTFNENNELYYEYEKNELNKDNNTNNENNSNNNSDDNSNNTKNDSDDESQKKNQIKVEIEEKEAKIFNKNLFDNAIRDSKDNTQTIILSTGKVTKEENYTQTLSTSANYTTFVMGASTNKDNVAIFDCKNYNKLNLLLYSVSSGRTIAIFNPETGETRGVKTPSMEEIMKNEELMKELNYLDNDKKLEFSDVSKTAEKHGIFIDVSSWNQVGFYTLDNSDMTFIFYAGLS